jgi:hypothetical protein
VNKVLLIEYKLWEREGGKREREEEEKEREEERVSE